MLSVVTRHGVGDREQRIQRVRILEAMVQVVHERGFANATVTSVSATARVSRRTFYEEFGDPEDCFLTVMSKGMRHVSMLISEGFDRAEDGSWVTGIRHALASLLVFFDAEPTYARVLLVEATSAGARARELRERHITALIGLIERRAGEPPGGHSQPHLTAGVMAALLGALHTQLITTPQRPLIGLLGPLMGLVTAPYLDREAVTRAIEEGEMAARELSARHDREHRPTVTPTPPEPPELLLHPRAHRARACMSYLAQHPGASNREIADAIGITGRTQTSALLARLHRAELLHKQPTSPGSANAWTLTPRGHQAIHTIQNRHKNPPSPAGE